MHFSTCVLFTRYFVGLVWAVFGGATPMALGAAPDIVLRDLCVPGIEPQVWGSSPRSLPTVYPMCSGFALDFVGSIIDRILPLHWLHTLGMPAPVCPLPSLAWCPCGELHWDWRYLISSLPLSSPDSSLTYQLPPLSPFCLSCSHSACQDPGMGDGLICATRKCLGMACGVQEPLRFELQPVFLLHF